MRRIFGTLMLLALVIASTSPDALAGRLTMSGVIVAVNEDDRTVLVDAAEGIRLVAVDPAAAKNLGSIRPGTRVEISGDTWAGMTIATSLRPAPTRRAAHQ